MDVVLHIGMQRTGSTFLQNEIFTKLENINFIGFWSRESFDTFFRAREIHLKKILLHIEQFDAESVRSEFFKHMDQSSTNLISYENIYCHMWKKNDDRLERIENIKQIFPKCRIIFGVREKKAVLSSWYKKYVASGGILSFEEFKRKG